MAREIEYYFRLVDNRRRVDYMSMEGAIHDDTKEPPIKHNLVTQICLDQRIYTEDVSEMDRARAKARWKLLAPGKQKHPEANMNTSVVYAEAIWLDTLVHNVNGHWRVIMCFFEDAIRDAVGDMGRNPYENVTYNGLSVDWSMFEKLGEEIGVEYKIDAWLSGVPLEYVIAE